MLSQRRARPRVIALLVALCFVPPISFVSALPWLNRQPDALVYLLSGVAATLVIVGSFLLAILHDRRLDEWRRSNARFASQWGLAAGSSLVALLLAAPNVRDLIVTLAARTADVANPDAKLVIFAFTFGFMAVAVAQLVCTAVLSTAWAMWKSRDPA